MLRSRLRMLPALVSHLDAVAMRVEDVGRVVARIIVKAGARWAVACRASVERSGVKRIGFLLAVGDEANMGDPRIGGARPEEDPTMTAESLQIRMSFRFLHTVVVDGVTNADRILRPKKFVRRPS